MTTTQLAAEAIALTKAAGKEWGWEDFATIVEDVAPGCIEIKTVKFGRHNK